MSLVCTCHEDDIPGTGDAREQQEFWDPRSKTSAPFTTSFELKH